MTAVLVDSNVLLDIMTEDRHWQSWSEEAVERASHRSRLVINPVIFGEVSVRFSSIEELDAILPKSEFDREPIPYEAAFAAGKAYVAYRRRGGTKLAVLPDFFVGAHAMTARYELLTRDTSRYRTYFPNVRLIAPE